jgi:hypothetical protein
VAQYLVESADDMAERDALEARERDALYPALLLSPRAGDAAVVYRRERAESRLITVALAHGLLSPEQHAAIGAFRLRQYALCGLYDVCRAARDTSEMDPSMESLAPEALHVCSGTADGRLLAYMCMETAKYRASVPTPGWSPPAPKHGSSRHGAPSHDSSVFGANPRPLFATELELFGPKVFGSLPYLRDVAVTRVRELSRMLRNQVVVSPLSVAATIEIVHTMSRLVTDPALAIAATLGCLGREGRGLMAQLGIPLLFAPDAPVLPQQVALARKTRGGSYWSDSANAQGQFWPFVIASEDVRRNPLHFARLDELLDLSVGELRRALVHFRRERRMIVPETLLSGLNDSAIRWTADSADGETPVPIS